MRKNCKICKEKQSKPPYRDFCSLLCYTKAVQSWKAAKSDKEKYIRLAMRKEEILNMDVDELIKQVKQK